MIKWEEIKKIVEAARRGELLDDREAPNRPHPLKGMVQGEDRILGLVLPNTEYEKKVTRNDGVVVSILTPDTKMTQDVPRCCIVLQKSRKFDNEAYPDIKEGSYLMFRENSGDYFEQFGVPYVNLQCQFVRFVYEPVGQLENYSGDLAREAFKKGEDDKLEALKNSEPLPSIPSSIRVY